MVLGRDVSLQIKPIIALDCNWNMRKTNRLHLAGGYEYSS